MNRRKFLQCLPATAAISSATPVLPQSLLEEKRCNRIYVASGEIDGPPCTSVDAAPGRASTPAELELEGVAIHRQATQLSGNYRRRYMVSEPGCGWNLVQQLHRWDCERFVRAAGRIRLQVEKLERPRKDLPYQSRSVVSRSWDQLLDLQASDRGR